MVPLVPLVTVPRPLGQQNTLKSLFQDQIEESPTTESTEAAKHILSTLLIATTRSATRSDATHDVAMHAWVIVRIAFVSIRMC